VTTIVRRGTTARGGLAAARAPTDLALGFRGRADDVARRLGARGAARVLDRLEDEPQRRAARLDGVALLLT